MIKSKLLAVALLMLAGSAAVSSAMAFEETCAGYSSRYRAAYRPWHYGYANTEWGGPVALVVPPNSEWTTDYQWGVCGTERTRIDHQFQRPYPGPGPYGPYGFLSTPHYPSSTRQFGVYPVRGPW